MDDIRFQQHTFSEIIRIEVKQIKANTGQLHDSYWISGIIYQPSAEAAISFVLCKLFSSSTLAVNIFHEVDTAFYIPLYIYISSMVSVPEL